ncbi:MAG: hypothetical protein IPG63_14715 [Xanthomonadales bacterium]|nr:hypothetical protein [Xanthomonadales bacterium]
MTRSQPPPTWINAYNGSPEFWPPYWDRTVLARIIDSPALCDRLEAIAHECGRNVGQEVLEACLSARGSWEAMPKVSASEQHEAVNDVRGLVEKLTVSMKRHEQALRAHCALPLTVETLFPETDRDYLRKASGEASPLCLQAVLLRLHDLLREPTTWEGGMKRPSKPHHRSAFRTSVAQHLIRLLRDRTGRPQYSVVADFVNVIVDDPDDPIHHTHIAKLDPGE